jgi:hypothetical protein
MQGVVRKWMNGSPSTPALNKQLSAVTSPPKTGPSNSAKSFVKPPVKSAVKPTPVPSSIQQTTVVSSGKKISKRSALSLAAFCFVGLMAFLVERSSRNSAIPEINLSETEKTRSVGSISGNTDFDGSVDKPKFSQFFFKGERVVFPEKNSPRQWLGSSPNHSAFRGTVVKVERGEIEFADDLGNQKFADIGDLKWEDMNALVLLIGQGNGRFITKIPEVGLISRTWTSTPRKLSSNNIQTSIPNPKTSIDGFLVGLLTGVVVVRKADAYEYALYDFDALNQKDHDYVNSYCR